MPNTISFSTSLTQALQQRAVSTLTPLLASIPSIASLYEDNKLQPNVKNQIPIVTATGSVLTNPTDWESGDSALAAIEVVPAEYSTPFHVSNADASNGILLSNLARSHADLLATTLMTQLLAPCTNANFATGVAAPAAGFGGADLDALCAAVASPNRVLLLDSSYYSRIRSLLSWTGSAWSMPGFSGVYEVSGVWPAGTYGFCADPSAIVAVYGLPISGLRPQPTVTRVPLPQVGLAVNASVWCSPGSRTVWGSYDIVLGVKVGNTAAGRLIKAQ